MQLQFKKNVVHHEIAVTLRLCCVYLSHFSLQVSLVRWQWTDHANKRAIMVIYGSPSEPIWPVIIGPTFYLVMPVFLWYSWLLCSIFVNMLIILVIYCRRLYLFHDMLYKRIVGQLEVYMEAMASQITDMSIVCPTACWCQQQRKHQCYASYCGPSWVESTHGWFPHPHPIPPIPNPPQRVSNAESVSMLWSHHETGSLY